MVVSDLQCQVHVRRPQLWCTVSQTCRYSIPAVAKSTSASIFAIQQAQTLRASCRRGKLAFTLLTINLKRTSQCLVKLMQRPGHTTIRAAPLNHHIHV